MEVGYVPVRRPEAKDGEVLFVGKVGNPVADPVPSGVVNWYAPEELLYVGKGEPESDDGAVAIEGEVPFVGNISDPLGSSVPDRGAPVKEGVDSVEPVPKAVTFTTMPVPVGTVEFPSATGEDALGDAAVTRGGTMIEGDVVLEAGEEAEINGTPVPELGRPVSERVRGAEPVPRGPVVFNKPIPVPVGLVRVPLLDFRGVPLTEPAVSGLTGVEEFDKGEGELVTKDPETELGIPVPERGSPVSEKLNGVVAFADGVIAPEGAVPVGTEAEELNAAVPERGRPVSEIVKGEVVLAESGISPEGVELSAPEAANPLPPAVLNDTTITDEEIVERMMVSDAVEVGELRAPDATKPVPPAVL